MQKKRLLQAAAIGAAAVLTLAACGGSGSGSAGEVPDVPKFEGPVGDGEGQLNILAWPGYAEDGTTDPKVDWVTPFEEATGCQVNVKTFGTSDEAVKLMQEGGYDVVSASGDASLRLIYGGNVQPVNLDLVPNYADIFDGLKMQSHNSVDGVGYGSDHPVAERMTPAVIRRLQAVDVDEGRDDGLPQAHGRPDEPGDRRVEPLPGEQAGQLVDGR